MARTRQAEREELLRMADFRTLSEAKALCLKWGMEPEGDSMAMAIQAINVGRLRGEVDACLVEHNGLKDGTHELILRERK